MSKENKSEFIQIRKDSIIPVIFAVIVVIILGLGVKNVIDSERYKAESANEQVESEFTTYMANELGFVMSYPTGWSVNPVDDNIMKTVLGVLSDDGKINLYKTKIPTEIAPVVFMHSDGESAYTQFLSLSLRGSNINIVDTESLEDELMSELKSLVNEDDVSSVTELEKSTRDGFIYLRVKANVNDDLVIYYTQVSTIVGKNLVTLIHGTSQPDNKMYTNMQRMLAGLTVMGYESAGVSVDNTTDPIGTGKLAPRTLPQDIQDAIAATIDEDELIQDTENMMEQEDAHNHDSSGSNEDTGSESGDITE